MRQGNFGQHNSRLRSGKDRFCKGSVLRAGNHQKRAFGAPGRGNGQKTEGSANEWAIQSFLGRINYDYLGKYLVEGNIRYDGTSRLHKDSRWGAFPSVSVGWRMSEENFMKPLTFVSNLKLRASYGELGNQNIGNYPYQELLKLNYNYTFNNQNVTPGAAPESLANQNLLWERTSAWDIGADVSLLDNKLSFVFDWYKKETKDILRSSQIPESIGLKAPTVNNGSVTNTGIELSITHQNQLENGLYYSVSAMINKNKNELTTFGEDEIGESSIKREGQPWDSFYMYKWIGIFQDEEEIKNHATQPYNPQPVYLLMIYVQDFLSGIIPVCVFCIEQPIRRRIIESDFDTVFMAGICKFLDQIAPV